MIAETSVVVEKIAPANQAVVDVRMLQKPAAKKADVCVTLRCKLFFLHCCYTSRYRYGEHESYACY